MSNKRMVEILRWNQEIEGYVIDKYGAFHQWVVVSAFGEEKVYAIVELSDGTVSLVLHHKVRFMKE